MSNIDLLIQDHMDNIRDLLKYYYKYQYSYNTIGYYRILYLNILAFDISNIKLRYNDYDTINEFINHIITRYHYYFQNLRFLNNK